ncbi:MAG: hypothetical protein JWQ49_4151, partial [Edaphobacter sp.]|nr:hypothetical protein [Edaphobacter sp.]
MNVQVIAPCRFRDGTSHHALSLAKAFGRLGHLVSLVNVQTSRLSDQYFDCGVSCQDVPPNDVRPAELDVVVGLWDEGTIA